MSFSPPVKFWYDKIHSYQQLIRLKEGNHPGMNRGHTYRTARHKNIIFHTISLLTSAKKVSVSRNFNRKRFGSRRCYIISLISLNAYRLQQTLGMRTGRKKLKFVCAENMVDEYGGTSIELLGLRRDAHAFKLRRSLMAMLLPTLIKRGWRGLSNGRWKVISALLTAHPLNEHSLATNYATTPIPT